MRGKSGIEKDSGDGEMDRFLDTEEGARTGTVLFVVLGGPTWTLLGFPILPPFPFEILTVGPS